jgi:surfactin synthase thioesterase subunit
MNNIMPKIFRNTASGPTARALLFFVYAGAGALSLDRFSSLLTTHCTLFGIRLPGRNNLFDEPFASVNASIYEVATHAVRSQWELDFVVWGHILRAYLAIETTVLLEPLGMKAPSI